MNSTNNKDCEVLLSQHIEPSSPQPVQGNDAQQSSDAFPPVQQLTQDFENCTWEQLEEKYTNAMNVHGLAEENLKSETAQLLEVFATWSQATVLHDENRALKRFKTQSQHVQNSEENVENKRRHYVEVVRAFESALALLNNQIKI